MVTFASSREIEPALLERFDIEGFHQRECVMVTLETPRRCAIPGTRDWGDLAEFAESRFLGLPSRSSTDRCRSLLADDGSRAVSDQGPPSDSRHRTGYARPNATTDRCRFCECLLW